LSDTFALVSHISSLRILLALTTLKNLWIFVWVVGSTYLHGMINHKLYVRFPDGYSKLDKVGKLNKALDGLPEAAWVWHQDFKVKLSL